MEPLPIPQEAENGSQLDKEANGKMEVFGFSVANGKDEDKDADVNKTCYFRSFGKTGKGGNKGNH